MRTPLLALAFTAAALSSLHAAPPIVNQLRPLFKGFGKKSDNKIDLLSGPREVKMNNGQVPGKEWQASFKGRKFKITIQDSTNVEVQQVINRLQRLPAPYLRACEVVSDPNENGVAVYADLGGAAAHGSKDYINIVPNADSMVLAHEMGHTLEQVASQSDPKTLEKWAAAIKSDAISVSRYGDQVAHEDLAEFAMAYALCLDAGPGQLEKLKGLSPKRYELWEAILKPASAH